MEDLSANEGELPAGEDEDKPAEQEGPSEEEIRKLAKKYDTVSRVPLKREEEYALIDAVQKTDNPAAKRTLLKAFDAFCRKISYAYAHKRGLDPDDAFQEARMGLLIGIKRFKPEYNVRLSTYAIWWINQSLNAFDSQTRTIQKIPQRMPKTQLEIYQKYTKLMRQHQADHGARPLTFRERARMEVALGCSLDKVREVIALHFQRSVSLNQPVRGKDGEEGDEAVNFLPDPSPLPDAVVSRVSNRALLVGLMDRVLDERSKTILQRRYLNSSGEEATLDDLSRELHVSRERIRQIEARAIESLTREYRRVVSVAESKRAIAVLSKGQRQQSLSGELLPPPV